MGGRAMPLDPGQDIIEHNERRIGKRHPIAVAIEWYPTLKPPRRRRKARSARTQDLSFSGAGFVDETNTDVSMGSVITVTISGVTGQAKVRIVKDATKPGLSYYGIEFSDRRLLDAVRGLIPDHIPSAPKSEAAPGAIAPARSSYREWPG